MNLTVHPGGPLRGCVRVLGDKSISHRALLLAALADGDSHIANFLPSGDCLATLACVRALGVEVTSIPSALLRAGPGPSPYEGTAFVVHGRGLHGLRPPAAPLDCARSGTTMRLLAGILAGQPFSSTLTGDRQLLRRPMRRIAEPLRSMGAEIETAGGHAPLTIRGRRLHGHEHTLAVAPAQAEGRGRVAARGPDLCAPAAQRRGAAGGRAGARLP
ncbi:MAG: hypothetical protein DRI80_12220, partial [Chloroflexota bacterium]